MKFRVAGELERQAWKGQKSPHITWRSIGRFGSVSADVINRSSADVVNLHWVTGGLLSVEEIGRITKPLVWTMHDMWPFAGTEHYAPEEPTPTRWQTGYHAENRPASEHGPDLDRWTWTRKRQHWQRPIHLVPVSGWLARCAESSALCGEWPSTVIPNVMDTEVFTQGSREHARSILGLSNEPIIAFTSSAGVSDERKGWRYLLASLPGVREIFPTARIMVIGQSSPNDEIPNDPRIMWMGNVDGNNAMAQLLQAADVIAVPSVLDNLPMTACEAQASGRAVVAFNVGGLADTVLHEQSGYLAQPFDISDFTHGLICAIENARGEDSWGQAARIYAEESWSPASVVKRYLDLYEQVVA